MGGHMGGHMGRHMGSQMGGHMWNHTGSHMGSSAHLLLNEKRKLSGEQLFSLVINVMFSFQPYWIVG